MNEDLIELVDFENICRLCLHSTGTLSDIFTACDDGKSLQKQILCITGLATENGDGLPSNICHRCRHIVEQASELRDVVEKSHKFLEKAVLDNVEQGSDTEPFDNETFLQSLSDTKIDQEKIKTEIFTKNHNDTFEKYVCNKKILHDEPFNELNAKFFSEDQDLSTEIPAEVPRAKVGQKPPADLVCQICLTQFASKEEVRPHVEQHYVGSDLQIYLDLKSSPFLCTFCDEIQLNKAQLVKHHRRHLGINPFVCKEPGCKYVGKNMDGLRHHSVVHGEARHACASCSASFRRRSRLVAHVTRTHAPRAARAPPAAPACGTCGMRTANEVALRRHMSAHHFIPKYPCPYGSCERAYPSLLQLRDHQRAHRGLRRYRCHLCSSDEFTSNAGVRRHIMETHARSRMLTCAKCPATFEEHAFYYRHWLAHHGPWAPHRCRACNQGFPAESQLLIHERTCDRLKSLLSIITEHTNGRTQPGDGVRNDELCGDDLLNGEIKNFDEMEQGDETDYGD